MERPNYQLEENPIYTEEIPKLLNTDPVMAESGAFYNLIFRMLNNTKAAFHHAGNLLLRHNEDSTSHGDLRAELANKANLDDVDFSGLEAAISEAQTTANVAKTTADTAKSTAETAKSTAETAQSTAGTAKTTADTAKSTADTAKSTADTAKTDAGTAKSTATAAQTTANAAMPKSGGTFTGQVYAADSADAAKRVRNIQVSTTDLTAGSSNLANGLIYLVYE